LRKVIRNESPECLKAGAAAWTNKFVTAKETGLGQRSFLSNTACYKTLRKQLMAMTQYHCAFCDGGLGVTSRETVEHFRPKSSFPQLAYEWPNLFPCCDKCQSQKSGKFDEALLKPDEPDYSFENFFISNYKTGELEPLPNAPATIRNQAEVTIKLYGLNSKARANARLRELKGFKRDQEKYMDDFSYRFFLE